MRLGFNVATPPQKPVLLYDGECNFCILWVQRWKHSTTDNVEYLAFQQPEVPVRFPEVPREGLATAVHLVETNGAVYQGAEAAFRALAHAPHEPLLLDWYLRWPAFRRISETCYRIVARRRRLFSFLTQVAWGRNLEPSSYRLVQWIFLRGLGVIYLVAFVSLWVQLMGLIGSNGILPANLTMFGVRQEAGLAHLGWQRYDLLPTLCWFSASDAFLTFQCAAGTLLAVLLMLDIAPAPCLFLLWLIYLSLSTVCREFLSFQWDTLLLETGFLAIFFAPLRLLPRFTSAGRAAAAAPPPKKIVVWLLRWLLFRLMLGSGLVKLLSGDPTWRHLTALKFHYETQPLPTWIGWYAHQLPARAQQFSTLVLLIIEIALPLLIFAPRRLRIIPCAGFVLLQVLIMLTGNYCFFNLLTVLLCLVLLDDAEVAALLPRRLRPALPGVAPGQASPDATTGPSGTSSSSTAPNRHRNWPIQLLFPLTCLAVLLPLMQCSSRFNWPHPLVSLFTWISPLRSFNTYGLFRVMTTNRLEIIIQGSDDGTHWLDYEFKYKPGDPKRRPEFVEPYQPRLDWQMWFAVFGDYRQNPWFIELCVRLMNGSPQVLGLLESNPFPRKPPRYLRALVYEYHFTDRATRRRTGAWWRRELRGQYLPAITRAQTRNL